MKFITRHRMVYSIVLICGFFATLLTLGLIPPQLIPAAMRKPRMKTQTEPLWDGKLVSPPIPAEVSVKLDFPEPVEAGATIRVLAELFIQGHFADQKTNKDFVDSVWRQWGDGRLGLILDHPSGKISSSVLANWHATNKLVWTVYLPHAGKHEGTILPTHSMSIYGKPQPLNSPPIIFNVVNPVFSVANALSIFGTILGPLVSIPGIVAFVRDRRKAKLEEGERKLKKRRKSKSSSEG